jgi:hypothetical protein
MLLEAGPEGTDRFKQFLERLNLSGSHSFSFCMRKPRRPAVSRTGRLRPSPDMLLLTSVTYDQSIEGIYVHDYQCLHAFPGVKSSATGAAAPARGAYAHYWPVIRIWRGGHRARPTITLQAL